MEHQALQPKNGYRSTHHPMPHWLGGGASGDKYLSLCIFGLSSGPIYKCIYIYTTNNSLKPYPSLFDLAFQYPFRLHEKMKSVRLTRSRVFFFFKKNELVSKTK